MGNFHNCWPQKNKLIFTKRELDTASGLYIADNLVFNTMCSW